MAPSVGSTSQERPRGQTNNILYNKTDADHQIEIQTELFDSSSAKDKVADTVEEF
jgi:hypothetical protein